MSPAVAIKGPLHCWHCGRQVTETVHTRTSYRVDYYSLHTGEVEPVTLQGWDDPSRTVTVLKLVRPNDVFTCVECYAKQAVREQRDQLFRPELAAEAEKEAAP